MRTVSEKVNVVVDDHVGGSLTGLHRSTTVFHQAVELANEPSVPVEVGAGDESAVRGVETVLQAGLGNVGARKHLGATPRLADALRQGIRTGESAPGASDTAFTASAVDQGGEPLGVGVESQCPVECGQSLCERSRPRGIDSSTFDCGNRQAIDLGEVARQ